MYLEIIAVVVLILGGGAFVLLSGSPKKQNPENPSEPIVVIPDVPEEPIQARDEKGRFIPDDESTPDVNEAWVGGVAPEKKTSKTKSKTPKAKVVKSKAAKARDEKAKKPKIKIAKK